jgi:hypothetical protein
MELQKIIELHPQLFHMAEAGTWPSIQQYGLLSTAAILDLHKVDEPQRTIYEHTHRREMMPITSTHAASMKLRDQKPMPPSRLVVGLTEGITPADWYSFLNRKVFFWSSEERLLRLLNARDYREITHDVLTINTESFLQEYAASVKMCHINSGSTYLVPAKRNYSSFKTIEEWPTKASGLPLKPIVEVTVDYQVPNIVNHVTKVVSMRGPNVIDTIFEIQ